MFGTLRLTAVWELLDCHMELVNFFYNSLFKTVLNKLVKLHETKVYFPYIHIYVCVCGCVCGWGGSDKALA
jgi:hypothetical protein